MFISHVINNLTLNNPNLNIQTKMKKLLLLMIAAVSTLAAWAYTETPLVTFDYSNISELPQYYLYTTSAQSNLAISTGTTAWPSYKDYSADGKGVFVITGNIGHNAWSSFEKYSIETISDKAGSAFTINGSGSGLSSLYTNITTNHGYGGYYGLHWIANPDIISSVGDNNYIRIRITFNAVDANTTANFIEAITVYKPGGVQLTNSSCSSKTYSDVFPDGHQANLWAVYEFDVLKSENPSFVSFKTPGGQGTNIALLINKVEFIELSDISDSELIKDAPRVTLQEVTKTETPAEDQTSIAIGKASLRQVETTGFEVAGSSEAYPAYYSKLNTFDIPFTVNLDKNKIGDGKTATLKAELIANSGLSSQGSLGTYTFNVPATSETVECAFKNVLYRINYQIKLTSVQYSDESEATAKEVSSEIYTNELSKPSVTISLKEKYSVLYNLSSSTTCAIFEDVIDTTNTDFVGYVSFSVSQADNDNIDAGVLTEGYNVGGSEYGLKGYKHRDSSEDYNDEIHNWAIIAEQRHSIPLHIANVNSGILTRTISVCYPMLNNHTQVVVGENKETEFKIVAGDINTGNMNVTSKTANYTFEDSEIENAQTSVANVAVDASGKVEFYNLQGVKVAEDALTPGIYVRRAAGKAVKVIVK
jgi:hypothetical protein